MPGVADAVLSARAAVDMLLGHRMVRRRGAEVAAEAGLRGARASAALEGRAVALADVRAGGVGDPVVQGALRVSAELGPLAETWPQAPRQVLARLHALVAAESVEPERLGRPRTGGEEVDDPLELGPAPEPAVVSTRLHTLMELLTKPSEAPALVVGAVVHGELLALRPFGTGDGIVARAAERVVLIARGLDPKALVAPEVGHAEHQEGYVRALRGYVAGTSTGVAGWVRHCADAITVAARDSLAVCEALQRG
ncbi:MAG TPA: oxidoreductase [Streptosporangiaceae bacterium]